VPRRAFDLVAFLAAAPTHEAALDAEVLGPSAEVRLARAGDRFTPYGRGVGGPTDVLRFLARRGVPAWLRRRTLVVVGARGVAWIPGQRIDREHAVTDATATVARLRIGADAGAD
jgi:tRNA(Ile)-lysidine synthase